jgi:hypothetical protein
VLTVVNNHIKPSKKGIIEITNKGLGFKLINSTSFGEFVFSAEFIQKNTKEDLFIKGNDGIPPRNQCEKDLEGTRRQTTEAWAIWPRK